MNYLSNIGVSHKVGFVPKQSNSNSIIFNATPVAINLSNGILSSNIIYCRAPGCTSCKAPGQKHCCKVCGTIDSDHRSRNCPLLFQQHYVNNCLPQNCSSRKVYCRAVGCTSCTRPGQKHYCKSCGDDDSNHLTANCKRVMSTRVYCRAVGCTTCTRPGQKHYCRSCGDDNSNHVTANCRRVVTSRVYCRAVGCTSCIHPGQKHFCKNCGNPDSDHVTSKCTRKSAVIIGGVLYHI